MFESVREQQSRRGTINHIKGLRSACNKRFVCISCPTIMEFQRMLMKGSVNI